MPVVAAVPVLHASVASAAYTFQTTTSYAAVPDLNLTISPVSGGFANDLPGNLIIATFTYAPTASASSGQVVQFTESFDGTPGSQVVTITGTLEYAYSPGFVAATFVPTAETQSGSGYTVPFPAINYLPDNAAGTSATLTLAVIPSSVPEPATFGFAGAAAAGCLLGRRRCRARV